MDAKFDNFSEMANLLSVKSRVSSDLSVLFSRFALRRLLSPYGDEKGTGVFVSTTHHVHMHVPYVRRNNPLSLYGTFPWSIDNRKKCYYRLLERKSMNWRKLLMAMPVRFHAILRKEGIAAAEGPSCLILDDTTLEK